MEELQETLEEGTLEAERIRKAESIYIQFNPKPSLQHVEYTPNTYKPPTFLQVFGLEAAVMLVSVVGATLVSAVTVGLILFISAINTDLNLIQGMENMPSWLTRGLQAAPVLFFIAGMLAFEGYAFSHGLASGKKETRVNFSKWPLIAAFTVMVSSGLLRSFGLVNYETIDVGTTEIVSFFYNLIQLVVVVSTGVSAPLIVYYGMKNVGFFITDFERVKDKSFTDFEDKEKIKLDEVLQRNKELELDHTEQLAIWGRKFLAWYKANAESIFGVVRSNKRIAEEKSEKDNGIMAAVKDYLDQMNISAHQVGVKQGDLISPSQIADELRERFPGHRDLAGAIRTALFRLRK